MRLIPVVSSSRYSLFLLLTVYLFTTVCIADETDEKAVPSQEQQAEQEPKKATTIAICADGTQGEECKNPDMRIITEEELKLKNGKDDPEIWLSILGRVFDVSKGADFYGPEKGYSGLAARDASVPFVTGTFTEEESKKLPSEHLNPGQLSGIDEWRSFYNNEEKYPFVGKLCCIYYDNEGNPTEELKLINTKVRDYQREMAEQKRKKQLEKKFKQQQEQQKKQQQNSQQQQQQKPKRKTVDTQHKKLMDNNSEKKTTTNENNNNDKKGSKWFNWW